MSVSKADRLFKVVVEFTTGSMICINFEEVLDRLEKRELDLMLKLAAEGKANGSTSPGFNAILNYLEELRHIRTEILEHKVDGN